MKKNAITKTETITPAVANLVAEDLKKRGLNVEIEYLNCYTEPCPNGDCSHISFVIPNEGEDWRDANLEGVKVIREVLKAYGVSTKGINDLTSSVKRQEAMNYGEGAEKSYFFRFWSSTAVAVPIEGHMPIELVEYIDEDTPETFVDSLIEVSGKKGENGLPLIEVGNHSYLVARTEAEKLERDDHFYAGNYCIYMLK